MAALQQASVLKAIVSLRCLFNYKDLFNLHHLVRRWCTATYTFFLSCDEINVTLEDVVNQLLLPILGNIDPSNIELSPEEEAMEAKLKKGMSGNVKLSHWVGAFSKASDIVCHATFVAFWLSSSLCCKTSLFPIIHKDFYRCESAIDPYISRSIVCAISYFVE